MKKIPTSSLIALPIATEDGVFMAFYSDTGLKELNFPPSDSSKPKSASIAKGNTVPTKIRNWHRLTETALKQILSGRDPKAFPPFDWSGTTPFQQAVWRGMLKIPSGKTQSYGELARSIRKPEAVRAVGGACGANPIPVLVPCHRVLAANGKIGGFSSGLDRKRHLLAQEGIAFKG